MAQNDLVGYAFGTFTRPSDTTQYGDGDAVTNATSDGTPAAIEFVGIVGSNLFGGGAAQTFKLTTNDTDIVAASFRLWLFNAAPTTVTNDNTAMVINAYAERANLIGYVDFSTFIAVTDGKISFGTPIYTTLFANAAVTSIYGLLQAKGTYTPASGEVFHFAIGSIRN